VDLIFLKDKIASSDKDNNSFRIIVRAISTHGGLASQLRVLHSTSLAGLATAERLAVSLRMSQSPGSKANPKSAGASHGPAIFRRHRIASRPLPVVDSRESEDAIQDDAG
jgi:hypothetical protein